MREGRALSIEVIRTAALLGVPALTTDPLATGAATFAAGLGASVWVVLVATIRQSIVPDALLGRVHGARHADQAGAAYQQAYFFGR